MSTVKSFKVDRNVLNILTTNEKKIFPILVKAAKKTEAIYNLQENHQYKGANFYPHGATKEEIEEAAREDSRVLSPFTIVKRDKSGSLVALDYHQVYVRELGHVSKLLAQAAAICENKSFKKYLEILAEALAKGSYQQADIAWLAIKGSNLDVVIGPHERYLDKLFFVKRAYQSSVAVIDHQKSQQARFIRDILYTTTGDRPHRITPPSIVDIQLQYCLIFTGFLASALFSRQHLPSDSETTARYGSRILAYLSAIDYKFDKLIYPIFEAVFEKSFKTGYSKELLKRGNYYYILLAAIAQQLHRYHNSRARLQELFPVIDEANSVASGISHAKHLVLKGAIDQKDLEAVMITQICWMFSEWILYKKSKIREDYLKGDALTFNFLMRVGALQEKQGISWPNFAKIFFEMENLAVIFTRFLEEGEYIDAQEFLSKYLTFESFKTFDRRLSKIKPI